MSKYTVGSLFAGVGGICQAFKEASCKVVWANEIDENSRKTYAANHKNVELTNKRDVRILTSKDVAPVDILTAGFPCQPFSHAGRANGFEDDRGQLFYEVTRLLREIKPKAFFLENVKSLATHNGGESFRTIAKEIKRSKYSFIPFILKASDYTDIPQGRERIYIVGFRNEELHFYDRPVLENFLRVGSAPVSSRFNIPLKRHRKTKHFTEFLDNSTVSSGDYYAKVENKIHKRVIDAVVDKSRVYQYRRWFVRENKSDVCPTLTANMGLGGHNIPIILDGELPRRLTPKECFNLQGFPKSFVIPDDVAKVHLYRQSGNSVVVPLVTRIAKEIVRVLNENRNS